MNLSEVFKKSTIVETELKEIYNKEKKLTAEIVLNHAKKKSSPLHELFTWNNTEAANQFRLWEARTLIKSVKITMTVGVEEVKVRKYINLRTDDENNANPWGANSEYKEVKEIMSDEKTKEILFQQAINELNAFRKKYHGLRQFEKLMVEIDKLLTAA